jgi:hypothetical protein
MTITPFALPREYHIHRNIEPAARHYSKLQSSAQLLVPEKVHLPSIVHGHSYDGVFFLASWRMRALYPLGFVRKRL